MSISEELKRAIRSGDDAKIKEIAIRRTAIRMAAIDDLPKELRECVHEYGWNVVNAFICVGVKNHRHIRHLVEMVLNEFSPTRGPSSSQGSKPDYRGVNYTEISHLTKAG